jgi:hypothetical protein
LAANATGEAETGPLRLQFDCSVKLAFQGSSISSDGGLLLHRELDDALGLTDKAAGLMADPRTGRNGRHRLAGLLRQSIFSRLAGYEDVNDADRLCRDPVMRQLVGGRAVKHGAASASAMGRFETEMLTRPENLAALADLPGHWIDAVHDRRPPKVVTLDMDSSESPVHGEQEGSAWNGHFRSKCLHPLFVFNQFGDLERCALRPGNVHSADGWEEVCALFWRDIRLRPGPRSPGGVSAPMPPSPSPNCSTCWSRRAGTTPSASRVTQSSTSRSRF